MFPKRRIFLRGAPLAALLLATACATRYAPPAGDPIDDPATRTACIETLREAYPDSFKMVQRLALTIRGRRYDFVGYLIVRRGAGFRALTLGEMGGKVFDLESKDGERRILLKPDSMPPNPLIDGAMGEIAHLFDPRAAQDARLVRSAEGRPILSSESEGVVREDTFDAPGRPVLRSIEARDGRIARRATYETPRLFAGWPRPIPTRIRIENLRWRYELDIQLLEFHVLPDDAGGPESR